LTQWRSVITLPHPDEPTALPSRFLVPPAYFVSPARPPSFLHQAKSEFMPGEEEISGNAQELYNIGQAAKMAATVMAIKAYRSLVRRYPHDTVAAEADYRLAQVMSGRTITWPRSYANVVRTIPRNCISMTRSRRCFESEKDLNGGKVKFLYIKVTSNLDQSSGLCRPPGSIR
jgi:hypothetical protein